LRGEKYSRKMEIGKIFCPDLENYAGKDFWRPMPGRSWRTMYYVELNIKNDFSSKGRHKDERNICFCIPRDKKGKF
jgi:hypothetical protein